MIIKRKQTNTWVVIPFFIVVSLVHSCANPVPPSGGDKDTTAPVLMSIEHTIKHGQTRLILAFNENITTSGPLIYSPKVIGSAIPQTSNIKLQRNHLIVDVPKNTNCLYLDRWVVDLNEKNPLVNNTLLLSNDSGEVLLKVKDIKQVKEKYGVFIKTDSLLYVPQGAKSSYYHFQGLPNKIHETYIIKNDNNQKIDNDEQYQVFYSVNRPTDTFFISLYPERKLYKSAYFLTNDKVYSLIGSPLYHEWLNRTDSFVINQDTLFLPWIHIVDIQNALQIDSFIKTNKNIKKTHVRLYGILDKDTFISDLGYYGFNHNSYLKKYHKTTSDSIKINYLFISKNEVTNPTDDTVYFRMSNEKMNYILILKPKETITITLPEGNYSWVSWINHQKNNQILNIEGYNFKELKPMDDPEVFFNSPKPWILKKNLSNTLILPEKESYNTGVTTK